MNKCSIVLIVISSIALLISAFLKLGGFGVTMKLGMPMGLKMMPLNDTMMGWLESPVPLAVAARVIKAVPVPAFNGTVGGGEIHVEFELKSWNLDGENTNTPNLTEAILVQETQELDEIQHYKVVLSKMNWNIFHFGSTIAIIVGILGIVAGILWKISIARTQSKNEKLLSG